MLVGFITAKTRIVDDHSRSSLCDLILNVFLPCNILSSFFNTNPSQLPSLGITFAISVLTLVACFFLAHFVLYRKAGKDQKRVLLYATIISNASFLGNPLIENIYGFDALIYSAVFLIPLRIALWTLGIAIFSGGTASIKKLVFHPCLVATYLGILVMVTGFSPPALVSRLAFSLGNCTTPVSMMVVGSILGLVSAKNMFTKLTLYYTALRLVFLPIALLGILVLLRAPVIPAGVSVILCGTPAPVTTSILATKYSGDKEFASKIIFVSTLLSVISIPFLIWLLQFALGN